LAVWVQLVEGMIEHFSTIAPAAREKFRRALSLATGAGDTRLRALCAAWLATADFNASDLPAMAEHAALALRCATPADHAAHARASLILADAYRYGGDEPRSVRWYGRARANASAEGDAAMVSALMHNMATMRASRIEQEHAFGQADEAEARRALMEAESAGHFESGVGTASLVASVPLVRAQLCAVLGRHDDAVSLFNEYLALARAEGSGNREPRFLAERAWCQQQRGRSVEALRDARQAALHLAAQLDPDDRAVAHARLAQVFEAQGKGDDARAHATCAQQSLAQHVAAQQQMLAVLQAAMADVDAG
jgi:tetratricopeptide (TPR) repeat protein